MIHGFYGHWYPGFYGIPIFGFIFGIALLVLVVYLIIFIVKKLRSNGILYNQSDTDPVMIAKRRYARGEISKEEYETIVKDLQVKP